MLCPIPQIAIKAFYEGDLKVNHCAKLALDGNVSVREAFLSMLEDWMLHLVERRDYDARLLPYILSALCDESPAIQLHAYEVVEAMGKEHEEENEAHLKDTMDWLPEELSAELPLPNMDPRTISAVRECLPPPFLAKGRPRLGARLVVRGVFTRTVKTLLKELQEWTTETRLNAARHLRSMLVYVEKHATQHIQQLLHALVAASRDEYIHEIVHQCARLVARTVPVDTWLKFLEVRLREEDLGTRAHAVQVLESLCRGAGGGRLKEHLADIFKLLVEPSTLKSEDTRLRMATASLLQTLLQLCGEDLGMCCCPLALLVHMSRTSREGMD